MARAHSDDVDTGSSQGCAAKHGLGAVTRPDRAGFGSRPICGATDTPKSGPWRTALLVRRFARDARGATAIEYALIAGLIFMLVVGSIRLYSSRMNSVYGQVTDAMSQIN